MSQRHVKMLNMRGGVDEGCTWVHFSVVFVHFLKMLLSFIKSISLLIG